MADEPFVLLDDCMIVGPSSGPGLQPLTLLQDDKRLEILLTPAAKIALIEALTASDDAEADPVP